MEKITYMDKNGHLQNYSEQLNDTVSVIYSLVGLADLVDQLFFSNRRRDLAM
jgi:hypothetical protein